MSGDLIIWRVLVSPFHNTVKKTTTLADGVKQAGQVDPVRVLMFAKACGKVFNQYRSISASQITHEVFNLTIYQFLDAP
mgnify:CR=1 FL=1